MDSILNLLDMNTILLVGGIITVILSSLNIFAKIFTSFMFLFLLKDYNKYLSKQKD